MAATKTAKARNPDRKSGKAWSKNHGVTKSKPAVDEKVLAPEKKVSAGGSPVTMPTVSFESLAKLMAARWPSTRKVRAIDAYIDWHKGRGGVKDEGVPLVVESNPEAKAPRQFRKYTGDRKNGR